MQKKQCTVAVDCPDTASGKKALPNDVVDGYILQLLLFLL